MTSSNKLFLIVLIVLILYGHLLVAGAVLAKFDYHVLSLTWPKSFCEIKLNKGDAKCADTPNNLPERFTIHGLWPSLYNASADIDPKTCSGDAFNFSTIDPKLQVRALDNWPDILYYKKANLGSTSAILLNKAFWASQWKKHGTCSNLDQNGYMNLALNTYDEVLPFITNTMVKHPSGGTINIQAFTTELQGFAKVKPKLRCKNLKNQQLLYEIHFHLDNSAIPNLIDAVNNHACDISKPARFP